MTRKTGQWRDKASIKGRRRAVRQALYMPMLVAKQFNKPLEDKYQSLLKAGKLKKVAITTIMQKMLILINALLRNHRMWQKIKA